MNTILRQQIKIWDNCLNSLTASQGTCHLLM